MSRLFGVLNGRKIYDDDPDLTTYQCNVEYVAIRSPVMPEATRCDYCGRKVTGDECKGCGAPVTE
jgi:hypothetical protein